MEDIDTVQLKNINIENAYDIVSLQTFDIKISIEEILKELCDKVFMYTNLYWKYVYLDRFFSVALMVTSMVVTIILSLEIVNMVENNNQVNCIALYVAFGVMVSNLIMIVSKLFFKTRSKCVSYNSLSKMYSNILTNAKKKLANPMNDIGFKNAYDDIIAQTNIIDQYEATYRFM